ncbi:hypothetical protein [Zavarzinella formosa]|uniref:hypothetical protein n=1 Tax=Zavarzinella formosa TaxID=360055 RepID=UPI00036B6C96|nr:hypothetical protein [Zavarzinella formosa]
MTMDQFVKHVKRAGFKLTIACDTEFEGPLTLTVQFAIRYRRCIFVQVYRDPSVPPPADGISLEGLRDSLGGACKKIKIRPVKPLTARLSPARVLADLVGLRYATPDAHVPDDRKQDSKALDVIRLQLVAHHWPADFFRVFGRKFFHSQLIGSRGNPPAMGLHPGKIMKFKQAGSGANYFQAPVVECLCTRFHRWPLAVTTFDTCQASDMQNLDDLAQAFLKVGKSGEISKEDKAAMRRTFELKTKPAYEYACRDAVLTLLLHEEMTTINREMYSKLGLDHAVQLRSTNGARVADIILRQLMSAAAGSTRLSVSRKSSAGDPPPRVSAAKLKELLGKGSAKFLSTEARSRFGPQIGQVHGGLLFSRSADQLLHLSPGRLCDVDLSGCYNAIVSTMRLYAGRPLLWEPGSHPTTLADAVCLARKHAAGRDAWIIRVSGPMNAPPNALIPSTRDAITTSNADRRRRAKPSPASGDEGRTELYADVIEGGIVAWATWEVIQALPKEIRESYEQLRVDALLMYPKAMVAATAGEFDTLVAAHERPDASWATQLDMGSLTLTTRDFINADYVTLAFDLGELAREFGRRRAEARAAHDKGSVLELMWKSMGNMMYGVIASPFLPTNNVIAANVITATARAQAFLMQMALNGIQVITDGCTYCRNQIPAGTLVDCLALDAEYPLRRMKKGVFLNPRAIPTDDGKFTEWLKKRIRRFFGQNETGLGELLAIFRFEHKRAGKDGPKVFDGLYSDGSNNYMKLIVDDEGGWHCVDFKARSYRDEAKQAIEPWLLQTALKDQYKRPAPITPSKSLMKWHDAVIVARQALRVLPGAGEKPPRVLVPLSNERITLNAYKMIKPSMYVFRTPAQSRRVRRVMKRFGNEFHAGLELLGLRRPVGSDRPRLLSSILEELADFIRSGRSDLSRKFNLGRGNKEFDMIKQTHVAEITRQKEKLKSELFQKIDASASPDWRTTGLIVTGAELRTIQDKP